jgi:hypothetical protein
LLTKIAVSKVHRRTTVTTTRDALTMLTEPDMQARYVAAALGVIETELRNPDTSASNRRALSALVASASRAATRLAEGLERQDGPPACSVNPPAASQKQSNVLAFRRA